MKYIVDYNNFSINENAEIFNEFVMLREDFNNNMTIIKNSIQNKFVCTIYYKGEQKGLVDDGYRVIEPYALGVNHLGNTVLRAWLLKGKSRRGRIDPKQVPGWRLFRVDRIHTISTSLQSFSVPRKGYNSQDEGMEEVTFSVKF